MSSEKSGRSNSTRSLSLFVALLAVTAGCHERVVIGTEPSDDPSVPSESAPDADDARADAGDENIDDEGTDESNDDETDDEADAEVDPSVPDEDD